MIRLSGTGSKQLLAVLCITLLCSHLTLSACNIGGIRSGIDDSGENGTNRASGLLENDVYSWTRDVGFSELTPQEQLELININRYRPEDANPHFSAVSVAPNGDIFAVGEIVATVEIARNTPSQALIARYNSDLELIAVLVQPKDIVYSDVVVDEQGFIYVAGISLMTA